MPRSTNVQPTHHVRTPHYANRTTAQLTLFQPPPPVWIPPPINPTSASNPAIHLWRVNLSHPILSTLATQYLPPHELRTIHQVSNSKLRRHRTASRVALRDILARYVGGCKPGDIEIKQMKGGKPMLSPFVHDMPLQFNVSHTGDVGLIAVSEGVSLGVDVESMQRSIPDPYPLMKRMLTVEECRNVVDLARTDNGSVCPHLLHRLLVTVWTRKEAFLKCKGTGIARGLRSFEVGVGLEQDQACVRSVDGCLKRADDWVVYNVDMHEPFVATVVAQSSTRLPLLCFEWQPNVP